jgi:hypothetical protein
VPGAAEPVSSPVVPADVLESVADVVAPAPSGTAPAEQPVTQRTRPTTTATSTTQRDDVGGAASSGTPSTTGPDAAAAAAPAAEAAVPHGTLPFSVRRSQDERPVSVDPATSLTSTRKASGGALAAPAPTTPSAAAVSAATARTLDAQPRATGAGRDAIATLDFEQSPAAPTGSPAGFGAGASGSVSLFALLTATLALAALFFSTPLHVPASWRSVHLISLLERPG